MEVRGEGDYIPNCKSSRSLLFIVTEIAGVTRVYRAVALTLHEGRNTESPTSPTDKARGERQTRTRYRTCPPTPAQVGPTVQVTWRRLPNTAAGHCSLLSLTACEHTRRFFLPSGVFPTPSPLPPPPSPACLRSRQVTRFSSRFLFSYSFFFFPSFFFFFFFFFLSRLTIPKL